MEVFFKVIYRGEIKSKLLIFFSIILSFLYSIFIFWLSDSINKYSINNEHPNDYNSPFISIIVSAHNEEKHIKNLLNSLINQTYNKNLFEIIIIDDRSTDETSKIISDYLNDRIKLIKIDKTPIGWAHKKWALNSGIDISKGEIILQTDADCIPNKCWIETIVNAFSDHNTGFVCGPSPLYSKNKIENILQLENNAQDAISAGGIINNLTLSCTGRNMAFLKKIFYDIGGYNNIEYLESGDDDLLMHKIKKNTNYKLKFIIDEQASVFTYPPQSINQFIQQRLRFASKGIFYYSWKSDISLRIILPLLYLSNIAICITLLQFAATSNASWLIPWIIKSSSDFYLTYNFFVKLNQKWSPFDCLILSIIHPFYIVVFGGLGPLINVKWK